MIDTSTMDKSIIVQSIHNFTSVVQHDCCDICAAKCKCGSCPIDDITKELFDIPSNSGDNVSEPSSSSCSEDSSNEDSSGDDLGCYKLKRFIVADLSSSDEDQ